MVKRLIVVVALIGVGVVAYSFRHGAPAMRVNIPSASPYAERTTSPKPISEANLDVPFVSQAPKGIWDEDHEEFCEEADALMAASYINRDYSVRDTSIADTKLYGIKEWEMKTFGYFKDTTAAETARIIREYFKISKVELVKNPSVSDLKGYLAAGRLVIVPTAGRQLGNPNFTGEGPLYHMVLLKGFTKDGQFIANDPGTRKGSNYIYEASVIMNAMHDWNGGQVESGAKIVIIVG